MQSWEYKGRIGCTGGCKAIASVTVRLTHEDAVTIGYEARLEWSVADRTLPTKLAGITLPAKRAEDVQNVVMASILRCLKVMHESSHGTVPFTPSPEFNRQGRHCAPGWTSATPS